MKRPPGLWLLLSAGVLWLCFQDVSCVRATSLIFGKATTTSTSTSTAAPGSESSSAAAEEEGVTEPILETANGTKLSGIPQQDYIHDPNLPRELNGYNLTEYLFLGRVPEVIDFKCDGLHDGFYASILLKCQVYHHCISGTRYDFLCANYTAFDQKTFICQFVSEVDCVNSKKFWHRNDNLYEATTTSTIKPQPFIHTPRTPSPILTGGVRRPGAPGLTGRRPNPPRRRRPAYEYYEDYEDEAEDYYEDPRYTATESTRTEGRRRKRPRPRPRPVYDDEYEEYEDDRYDRRRGGGRRDDERPYKRRRPGRRNKNDSRRKYEDEYEEDVEDEDPRFDRSEEVKNKRPKDDRRRKPDSEEEVAKDDRRVDKRRQEEPADDKKEKRPGDDRRYDKRRQEEPVDDKKDRRSGDDRRYDNKRRQEEVADDKKEKEEKRPGDDRRYDKRRQEEVGDDKKEKEERRPGDDRRYDKRRQEEVVDDKRPEDNNRRRRPDDDDDDSDRRYRPRKTPRRPVVDEYDEEVRRPNRKKESTAVEEVKPVIKPAGGSLYDRSRFSSRIRPPGVKQQADNIASKSSTSKPTKASIEDEEYYDDDYEDEPAPKPKTASPKGDSSAASNIDSRKSQRPREEVREKAKPLAPRSRSTSTKKPDVEDDYEYEEERPRRPLKAKNDDRRVGQGSRKRPAVEEYDDYEEIDKKSTTTQSSRGLFKDRKFGREDSKPRTSTTSTTTTTTTTTTTEAPVLKEETTKTPFRVVKRPFLPSRGGNPYSARGLQPVGLKSETTPKPRESSEEEVLTSKSSESKEYEDSSLQEKKEEEEQQYFKPSPVVVKVPVRPKYPQAPEEEYTPVSNRPINPVRYKAIKEYDSRSTPKPKPAEKNPLDINENEYDVTLNDALNPTLPNLPVRSFPTGFSVANDYTFSAFHRPRYVVDASINQASSEYSYRYKAPQRYEAYNSGRNDQEFSPATYTNVNAQNYQNFRPSPRVAQTQAQTYYTTY